MKTFFKNALLNLSGIVFLVATTPSSVLAEHDSQVDAIIRVNYYGVVGNFRDRDGYLNVWSGTTPGVSEIVGKAIAGDRVKVEYKESTYRGDFCYITNLKLLQQGFTTNAVAHPLQGKSRGWANCKYILPDFSGASKRDRRLTPTNKF